MCFDVSRGFFPRTDGLHNLPAPGGGFFSRESLGSGDAEVLPVRAGIEVVLAQMAHRQLLEGLATDETFNGVFFDAFFPVW